MDVKLCPRSWRGSRFTFGAQRLHLLGVSTDKSAPAAGENAAVRLKARLACCSTPFWTEFGVVPSLVIPRRSLDPVDAWLIPVVGPEEVFQPRGPCSPCPRWRGVNHNNLRSLCRVSRTSSAADPPVPARFGLVNARSLANKTFELKDLNFLCVTETWLSDGESSAFTEFLHHDCCYFNSPRKSGRGGGIAIVYKSHYKCKQILL